MATSTTCRFVVLTLINARHNGYTIKADALGKGPKNHGRFEVVESDQFGAQQHTEFWNAYILFTSLML